MKTITLLGSIGTHSIGIEDRQGKCSSICHETQFSWQLDVWIRLMRQRSSVLDAIDRVHIRVAQIKVFPNAVLYVQIRKVLNFLRDKNQIRQWDYVHIDSQGHGKTFHINGQFKNVVVDGAIVTQCQPIEGTATDGIRGQSGEVVPGIRHDVIRCIVVSIGAYIAYTIQATNTSFDVV